MDLGEVGNGAIVGREDRLMGASRQTGVLAILEDGNVPATSSPLLC